MARAPARRGSSVIDQLNLRPSGGAIALLVVYVIGWALLRFGGELAEFIGAHLLLTPRRALWPELWQLVTSAFFLSRLREVLNIAVTLLFFGNTIEQLLGKRGLWTVWVVGAFGGGLMMALVGLALAPTMAFTGGGEGTALLVVYALMLNNQRASLFGAVEMSAGSIAWIWIGIQALGAFFDMGEGHVGPAVIELAEMFGGGLAGWALTRFYFNRAVVRGGGVGDALDRFKMWRLRRRYKVISGGRGGDDDKRYLN